MSPRQQSPSGTADEPGRRERKRQQQLDHIADTAWALFEASGFEAVTMERIAEASDVSKVTLYRHFPVKEALLRHVFHRDLRAAWPALQSDLAAVAPGRARMARFLALQAAWCEGQRSFLLPYLRFRLSELQAPGDGRERSGLDAIFSELIAQGQTAGEFRTDVPAALLAMQFQFVHLATLLRCLTEPGLSMEKELARTLDLFCDGMVIRP